MAEYARQYDYYDDFDLELNQNSSVAPQRRSGRGVIVPMPKRDYKNLKVVHRRSPLKVLAIILVSSFFLSGMAGVLSVNVKITETNNQILKLDQEIFRVSSDNARLQLEIEEMMSIKNIEDYAIIQLGMQKISRNQVEYIKLNDSDKIVIDKSNDSIFDKIINLFD